MSARAAAGDRRPISGQRRTGSGGASGAAGTMTTAGAATHDDILEKTGRRLLEN